MQLITLQKTRNWLERQFESRVYLEARSSLPPNSCKSRFSPKLPASPHALSICSIHSNSDHFRVREAFEESWAKIGCEYIDMYLMHWPQAVVSESGQSFRGKPNTIYQHDNRSQNGIVAGRALPFEESPTFIEVWKEMEKLLETGAHALRTHRRAVITFEREQVKSSPSESPTSLSGTSSSYSHTARSYRRRIKSRYTQPIRSSSCKSTARRKAS